MRLKVYRATAVADAMRQVRGELGPDALILSTRRVGEGVEVTACLEAVAAPPMLPPDPARTRLLAWHGLPRDLCDTLATGPLAAALDSAVRFTRLDLAAGGKPLLFAGPPGAGKTLTVVRLAARLVMAGRAPLIICADSQRAGATEQVACFANLLGVAVRTADGPLDAARAVARRQGAAPVLIDTAGVDLFAETERDALTTMASACDAAIVAVLPAGIDPFEAADLGAVLVAAGATALAVTRLDTARRLGALITAARPGLALAEAGISPAAADGMVPLTAAFLAERLSRQPAPLPAATGARHA
jgi:flagellar biosynthesis protein FlhF